MGYSCNSPYTWAVKIGRYGDNREQTVEKSMVGIIYKREATHSHDVSARELRVMPYQNWCRNIRKFSLPKFTYL